MRSIAFRSFARCLKAPVSLRLKPVLWGKMERRKRLEAALARCEYIVSRGRRYRDVVTPEIEPEPIVRPKVKTTSSDADAARSEATSCSCAS